MLSSVVSLLFTSLLATVANAGIDGWHMDYVYTVANEMLDPIINPNGQSAHMHKFVGGSGIHAAYSSDVYKGARCSSSNVKADKSNYWMPNLYWINDPARPDNTTFIAISALVRFYYFLPRTSNDVPVEPFPEGLRMIVGDPNSKTDDTSGIVQFGCQQQANFANTIYGPNFNFDSYCPWGVKTEVRFPQCWDGVNLYKSDMSHMSYPVGWRRNGDVRNGPCPATHPVRVPTILLEYTWHPEDVAPNQKVKGRLAWANGDTTGAGIHADFIAGWDTNVLRQALNNPACLPGSSMPFERCPTLAPYHDINAAKSCNVPDKGILKQPSGNADKITIPSLPGCNKLWASGAKPTCNPPVAGLSVAGLTGTNGPLQVPAAQQRAFKLPTGTGWQYAGCFSDDDWNPTFAGKTTFNDAAMTLELCTSTCAANGMNFAALELRGGNRCTCAPKNSLNLAAGLYNISQCSQPCPGNSKQICGDNYRMAVYYTSDTSAGSGSSAPARADGLLGCYADTTAAPALTDYFVQSNSMTIEKCTQTCKERGFALAGAEYSTQCKCGNVYKGSQILPPTSCDMPCKGNTSQICGGSYKMSLYNTTNVVIPKARKRAYPYPVV